MHRIACIVGGLLAAAALGSPAQAESTFVPDLVHTSTYLVCSGTTKLAQANAAIDGTKTVGWDTIPPTQSFQNGAGCASAEPFVAGTSQPDAVLDLPMAGTFTGNLSAMSVRLHAVDTTARVSSSQLLLVDVIIDGRMRVHQEPIEVATVRSLNGTIGVVEFSVTNIRLLDELDSTTTHTVEVRVSTRYPDAGTLTGWIWDATEFPSGITFNPARLASVRVRAAA